MVKFSLFQKIAAGILVTALLIIMFIGVNPVIKQEPIFSASNSVANLFVDGDKEGTDLITAELKAGINQEDINKAAASLEQLDVDDDVESMVLLGLILAIDNAQKQLDERNDSLKQED